MGEESSTKAQAKRVKMLREYFCLTETELARRLRVSQAVVAAIETGQISMSDKIMYDICFVLGCNYKWLKTGAGQISEAPPYDIEGVADRVKMIREAEGLSQVKFAKEISCSSGLIALAEKHRTHYSKDVLKRIAGTFHVSLSWLMTGEEDADMDIEEELEEIERFFRKHPVQRKAYLEKIRTGMAIIE